MDPLLFRSRWISWFQIRLPLFLMNYSVWEKPANKGKKKQKEKLNHFIIKGIFSINNLHLKFQVVYSCTACKVNLWIFTLAFSFHQDFGDVKCCRLTGQLNDITNKLYSTASGMRRANHQRFRSTNSSPKSDRQCIVTSNLKLVQILKKIC